MAHSLSTDASLPDGNFEDAFSGTRFRSETINGSIWQTLQRQGESEKLRISYVIGSGSHAFGMLAQVGDHLFQSPISFYTSRRAWDLAPGYEQSTKPDFSRPVTLECLTCHSDKPLPIAGTLNRYHEPAFSGAGIQCDRCHGDATEHLRNPVPGSIVNPAKLPNAARDSICEQCHLTGEIRIPNAGRSIADFRPGEALEDVYTVYVARQPAGKTIKVVSQAEELALSTCARKSEGRLWCGTCHNPHETPVRPAEYFRDRCLACHGTTLSKEHAAPGQDCVSCHMPRRPAKDGGHTAFTDHRIARRPEPEADGTAESELSAWREPPQSTRDRNLALALITVGLENGQADQVIRGYRMLNRMQGQLSNDAAALTTLGTVLLKGKQPAEAERRFARALQLRPDYAPYEVNIAVALLAENKQDDAIRHLERAVQLDPLLQQGVELLGHAYGTQGDTAKAEALLARYRAAMGIAVKPAE